MLKPYTYLEFLREDMTDFNLTDDYHQIHENLWLGSHPNSMSDLSKFEMIFCFDGRPFYSISKQQTVVCHPFDDDDNYLPDMKKIDTIVEMVKDCSNRAPVLLHCSAGINRSALVLAMTLIRHHNMQPQQAIYLIQSRRSKHCLFNQTFQNYLLKMPLFS